MCGALFRWPDPRASASCPPLPESAVRPSGAMATLYTSRGVPAEVCAALFRWPGPRASASCPSSPRVRFGRPGQWRRRTRLECPVKVRSSFPSVQVPELQRLVCRPGKRGSAIRGNGDAEHRTGVPGERAQLLSGGQVPELQRLVRAPGERVRPSGPMATLVTAPECPVEGAKLFSAGQVPELQRLVRTPRERRSAVRGDGGYAQPCRSAR